MSMLYSAAGEDGRRRAELVGDGAGGLSQARIHRRDAACGGALRCSEAVPVTNTNNNNTNIIKNTKTTTNE